MADEFVDYAFQDLPRKKIKKYAAQYEGVDMAALMDADEENFPFVVRCDTGLPDNEPGAFQVMLWNVYNGIMVHLDEDSVRHYATVRYLREHAYPSFETCEEAELWAAEHNWPRKNRDGA